MQLPTNATSEQLKAAAKALKLIAKAHALSKEIERVGIEAQRILREAGMLGRAEELRQTAIKEFEGNSENIPIGSVVKGVQ